jgi:hypothetical protein
VRILQVALFAPPGYKPALIRRRKSVR